MCTSTYYTQKKSFVKGVFEKKVKNVKKCKKIAHFFRRVVRKALFPKNPPENLTNKNSMLT